MSRISNEVIVERIDGMEKLVNLKFNALEKKFDTWKEDVEPEIKANTKLRENAKGIIAGIAFVCTMAGIGAAKAYDKIKFW